MLWFKSLMAQKTEYRKQKNIKQRKVSGIFKNMHYMLIIFYAEFQPSEVLIESWNFGGWSTGLLLF